MNHFFKNTLLAAALLGATTAANAHRIWLLPSTFTLSGEEQWVTVDGAISNDLFFPNHVAMALGNISVTAPDGSLVALENGLRGKFRSTFDVKLDQQGTYRISEKAAAYFARWMEGGEEKRARASLDDLLARGIADKEGANFMVARRNVDTFVTLGAPTDTSFAATGVGLELVPDTHPNDVYVGEPVRFRFTLDGNPAADVEVMIVKGHDRYRDTGGEIKTKTDAEGYVQFTPGTPGRYWMNAFTIAGKVEEQGVELNRRVSYTLTFEALQN